MKVAFGIPLLTSPYYMEYIKPTIDNNYGNIENKISNYVNFNNITEFCWVSSKRNFLDLDITEDIINSSVSLDEIMRIVSKSRDVSFIKNDRDQYGYQKNDDKFVRLTVNDMTGIVSLRYFDGGDRDIGKISMTYKFTLPIKYFANYIFKNSSSIIEKAIMFEGRNSGIREAKLWLYLLCKDIPEELVYKFLSLTKERGDILIHSNNKKTVLFSVCSNTMIFTPDLKSKSNVDFMSSCIAADDKLKNQIIKAYPDKIGKRNRYSAPYILLKRKMRSAETETNYIENINYICNGLSTYIHNGIKTPANISKVVISDSFRDISMKAFDTLKNQLTFDVYYMISNTMAKVIKKYHKSTECPFFGLNNEGIEKALVSKEFDIAIFNNTFFNSYAGIFSDEIRL